MNDLVSYGKRYTTGIVINSNMIQRNENSILELLTNKDGNKKRGM
jgi:hypothetical protein